MTREELENIARRSHDMKGIIRELDRQLRQLEKEQAEAVSRSEALNKRSLKNLVGTFLGRTGKQLRETELRLYMLDKKRQELTRRRAAVEEERGACEALLGASGKKAAVCVYRLENQARDIAAAIRQGDAARELCKGLRRALEQAQEYGWMDAAGKNYAAHEAKHTRLSDVADMVKYLGDQLEEFDFALEALDMTFETGDVPQVKGCLYDGMLMDWIVLKRIDDALERVKALGRCVSETILRLERRQEENLKERGFLADGMEKVGISGE